MGWSRRLEISSGTTRWTRGAAPSMAPRSMSRSRTRLAACGNVPLYNVISTYRNGSALSGEREQPIMVHRAIFGSIERFFGVLTESTAGDYPFWIAPVQLRLLPVSDDFRPYCEEALAAAKAAGIRAEIDVGGRSLGKQIKVSNQQKVSMFAVIG